jgi:hypothetical protein
MALNVTSPIGNTLTVPGGYEAGQALVKGDLVCIRGSNGLVYRADCVDTSLRPCLGVVDQAYADGDLVAIVCVALIDGASGLNPGSTVYLSTTGDATTTRPGGGFCQALGFAVTDTKWFLLAVQAYA